MRLDKYLVEKGYFESRNRALDAINSGKVTLNGNRAKASAKVSDDSSVEVAEEKFYVSRAAKKLEGFFGIYSHIDLSGKSALDIGSSTGGFAQILLEKGVGSLTCVDVGSDQLHHSLQDDARLTLREETDIRDFVSKERFDIVTCDVSFISVMHIIEDIDRLAGNNIILLYKPQFEVGREAKRDSKGVVTDLDAIERKQEAFQTITEILKWKFVSLTPSKVAGKEGNREWFYHFIKEKNRTEEKSKIEI